MTIKRLLIYILLITVTTSAWSQNDTADDGDDFTSTGKDKKRIELVDDSLYYDEYAYLYDYKITDNIFLLAQVGISHSMSENTRTGNFLSNMRPSFTIGIGKWLFPTFGLRLTAGVRPQVGRADWELCDLPAVGWNPAAGERYPFGNYKFTVFAGYFDALVNFTNVVFKYKEDRKFNLVGIIGLGYNRSYGFEKDKLKAWSDGVKYVSNDGNATQAFKYPVNTESANYFAAHVGFQGRYKLSNAWDITAEVTLNGTDDRYNGHEYDRVYDTYVDVLLGAQFHLKDSHGRRRFHYVKHLESDVLARLAQMAGDENEKLNDANMMMPEIYEKVRLSEALQTTISFYVDRYYITDAQKKNLKSVANFLATHPDINLIVTGYADIETAYPAYNLRLSQKRAQAVYDMLVDEFKVPKERLRIDFKGDTVQPYDQVNEWNRAVIFFLDRNGGDSQLLESEDTGEE